VCRRFLQNPYKRFLPSHWYDESPEELACPEPGESVRAFFSQATLREAAIAPALSPGSAPAREKKAAGPARHRGAAGRSRRAPGRTEPS
jgi:hypothetical protein